MSRFESRWNPQAPAAQQRRAAVLARLATLRTLEDRAAAASARSRPVFEKRGQLLPRERVALLLDPGSANARFTNPVNDPALLPIIVEQTRLNNHLGEFQVAFMDYVSAVEQATMDQEHTEAAAQASFA